MKSMMRASLSVVFFALAAATGCNVGTLNLLPGAKVADNINVGMPTPAPTPTVTPQATGSAIDPGQLAREIVKAMPTALPSATTSPPPGERIREGFWSRSRTAADSMGDKDVAEGSRLVVKLTGDKKDPLVRRARSSPEDKPWVGVGFLGLVPEEKDWVGIEYDAERGWFRIFGSKTIIIITEEAFLTE